MKFLPLPCTSIFCERHKSAANPDMGKKSTLKSASTIYGETSNVGLSKFS
jgi:hypothetical protein